MLILLKKKFSYAVQIGFAYILLQSLWYKELTITNIVLWHHGIVPCLKHVSV